MFKFLKDLFGILSLIGQWLHDRAIRNEVHQEYELEALRRLNHAKDIDSQPTPSDPSDIFDSLLPPGSSGDLGQADSLSTEDGKVDPRYATTEIRVRGPGQDP